MKFKIKSTISLETEDESSLLDVIRPENKTMKDGTVTSTKQEGKVISEIIGEMSIGTLLNTIDDILKTAILFDNVSDTTKTE